MAFDRSNWSNVKPLSITNNIAFDSSKTACEQVSTWWRRAVSSADQALERLRCVSVVVNIIGTSANMVIDLKITGDRIQKGFHLAIVAKHASRQPDSFFVQDLCPSPRSLHGSRNLISIAPITPRSWSDRG